MNCDRRGSRFSTKDWNEPRVGLALTIGGIAGIVSQTPAGALVDRLKSKRALIAAGAFALAIGALLIAFLPWFWPVVTAHVLIGAMSSFFMPAIAAISLGIVGQKLFNLRQGRNQTFNSAGKASTLLRFHQALVRRKYHLLYGSNEYMAPN